MVLLGYAHLMVAADQVHSTTHLPLGVQLASDLVGAGEGLHWSLDDFVYGAKVHHQSDLAIFLPYKMASATPVCVVMDLLYEASCQEVPHQLLGGLLIMLWCDSCR